MFESVRQVLWSRRHHGRRIVAYAVLALLGLSAVTYVTVAGRPGPTWRARPWPCPPARQWGKTRTQL